MVRDSVRHAQCMSLSRTVHVLGSLQGSPRPHLCNSGADKRPRVCLCMDDISQRTAGDARTRRRVGVQGQAPVRVTFYRDGRLERHGDPPGFLPARILRSPHAPLAPAVLQQRRSRLPPACSVHCSVAYSVQRITTAPAVWPGSRVLLYMISLCALLALQSSCA
jgi:hypothetical protein